jgi:hypothetical protein
VIKRGVAVKSLSLLREEMGDRVKALVILIIALRHRCGIYYRRPDRSPGAQTEKKSADKER